MKRSIGQPSICQLELFALPRHQLMKWCVFILGWQNGSWLLMGWQIDALKLSWLIEGWWMDRVPIHSWLICVLKRTLLDQRSWWKKRELDQACSCQSRTHTMPEPKMKYKYSKVQFSNILLLEDFLLVQAKCDSAIVNSKIRPTASSTASKYIRDLEMVYMN